MNHVNQEKSQCTVGEVLERAARIAGTAQISTVEALREARLERDRQLMEPMTQRKTATTGACRASTVKAR